VRGCVRVLLSIAMVLAIAPPVSAEQGASETTSGPERRGQPTGLGFRIRGAALHQFGTDIDGGGDFDVTRTAAEASVRYAFSETSFVGLAAGFGWDGYGFSPGAQIGGQDPWSEIQSLRISAPVIVDLTEKWRMLAIPILRFTAEHAADWNDGLTGGGIIGFSYQIGKRLRLGPGIGVLSELEDDPTIFPVILIDWRPTDRLRFETGRSLGSSQGPGFLATYTFLPWLEGSLGFRYEKQRFRLASNSAAQGGIAEDRGFPVLAG
jgi:hypothetical protein